MAPAARPPPRRASAPARALRKGAEALFGAEVLTKQGFKHALMQGVNLGECWRVASGGGSRRLVERRRGHCQSLIPPSQNTQLSKQASSSPPP